MADDKSHASLGSHRTAGSKGSKGSKGSRSTRSHGSSSRGSYADTGRHGSNFSTVAPFVIAKPFILKKQRVREEAAAKARQVATAEEMLAADREAKIFEREMKLGRKLTARELKQHEPGGGVHLTSAEVREYLGLDGPVRNVPRKRSISAESGGQMVADLSAVKKGQDAAGGDGPAGVLSAEASFIQKRRELREVMEAREDKVEKTMTPEMAAMAKKWREKAEANAQRRQQGGLDTLAEEPESDDDRPLVAYDYSGGHGGRRWHRPSKYARASGGVAPGAADKAVKTLTPADFARAEEADVEFLESPMPLPQDPPGWRYKAGGAGVGYYFVRDQAMLEDLTTNRRSRSSVTGAPQVEKRQGWGRRCMRAFAAKGSIISSNDGGTRSINLDISGPDLVSVYSAANAAYQRAEEIFDNPRIQSQPSTLSLAQPLIQIMPDWDRAAELGLGAESIGFTVASLTEGSYVDDFFLDDEKIDIYVYGSEGRNPSLDSLPDVMVHTPQGATLPLSSLATIEETVDTSTVRRVDGRRTVTLNVIPPDDVPLEAGVERVRTELLQFMRDSGALPANVNVDISGASDQLNATREALTGNFIIAIAIVYLLLVAIFAHWGFPLLIMTAIPLGVAGGIVGLALMNLVGGLLPMIGLQPLRQPFDMITMLGFLILMGTVVNNPILVVDQARQNLRQKGVTVVQAVTAAVQTRLRPIAMTTLTTICGLSPLVFLPGEGTELYRGVGAIVLFGLLGAAIVTVTFLPSLTIFVLGWRERWRRSREV